MTESIPVYLDVDTGVDDALAILLTVRHPALDVRGITTVVGNVDLEQVTRNTLQVLEVAGAPDVPVISGASRPLLSPPRASAAVHGADGLGNAGLPDPERGRDGDDAVAFLRDELMAAPEPVNLIALAPLTNLAKGQPCWLVWKKSATKPLRPKNSKPAPKYPYLKPAPTPSAK